MSDRPCTCHPDDNPPVPCPQKFSLSECRAAALVEPMAWERAWSRNAETPKKERNQIDECERMRDVPEHSLDYKHALESAIRKLVAQRESYAKTLAAAEEAIRFFGTPENAALAAEQSKRGGVGDEAERPNWRPVPPRACITPTHEAADAFWKYWKENGETHKHGYYESTWGAINAALACGYAAPPLDPEKRRRVKDLVDALTHWGPHMDQESADEAAALLREGWGV